MTKDNVDNTNGKYMARRKYYVPKDEYIRQYEEYNEIVNRENEVTLTEEQD